LLANNVRYLYIAFGHCFQTLRQEIIRATDPQISFADLEFIRQGIDMDPVFKNVDEFLDGHPELEELVRQDL